MKKYTHRNIMSLDRDYLLERYYYCRRRKTLCCRKTKKPIGTKNGMGYLCFRYKGRDAYVHRAIAQIFSDVDIKDIIIHHRDDNPLNNSKENLMLTNQRTNILKSKKPTGKFQGVTCRQLPSGPRYYARISVLNKKYVGKSRTTELDAYIDYLQLWAKHNGIPSMPEKIFDDYLKYFRNASKPTTKNKRNK